MWTSTKIEALKKEYESVKPENRPRRASSKSRNAISMPDNEWRAQWNAHKKNNTTDEKKRGSPKNGQVSS